MQIQKLSFTQSKQIGLCDFASEGVIMTCIKMIVASGLNMQLTWTRAALRSDVHDKLLKIK